LPYGSSHLKGVTRWHTQEPESITQARSYQTCPQSFWTAGKAAGA
jgi:hypothetical protein